MPQAQGANLGEELGKEEWWKNRTEEEKRNTPTSYYPLP